MVPAYAATMWLITSAFLVKAFDRKTGQMHKLVAVAAPIAGTIAMISATILPNIMPVFRFPTPTGIYAIGTLTYHLIDQDRREEFTANPNDRRELMVQVWYPAMPNQSQKRVRYLQDGSILAPVAQLLKLPGFVLTHLKYVPTNAIRSAPVAKNKSSYPVLIFSHGRGGFRQHNMFQVQELVSQGYIVAAIDHSYVAAGVDFPDGRRASFDARMLDRAFIDKMVPYLSQDVGVTLDYLAVINRADPNHILSGKVDIRRAGVFGVSIGGAVAADACLRDPRLKACLSMDNFMPEAVVRRGLSQPTMWIGRDKATMQREGWAPADINEAETTVRSVFEGLKEPGYLVLISGMFHQNFSDFPYFVISPLDRWLALDGPINARRGHAIVNAYTLAFFDRHLRDFGKQSVLDGSDAKYPEVVLKRNN